MRNFIAKCNQNTLTKITTDISSMTEMSRAVFYFHMLRYRIPKTCYNHALSNDDKTYFLGSLNKYGPLLGIT
jgi:hypothetical protein